MRIVLSLALTIFASAKSQHTTRRLLEPLNDSANVTEDQSAQESNLEEQSGNGDFDSWEIYTLCEAYTNFNGMDCPSQTILAWACPDLAEIDCMAEIEDYCEDLSRELRRQHKYGLFGSKECDGFCFSTCFLKCLDFVTDCCPCNDSCLVELDAASIFAEDNLPRCRGPFAYEAMNSATIRPANKNYDCPESSISGNMISSVEASSTSTPLCEDVLPRCVSTYRGKAIESAVSSIADIVINEEGVGIGFRCDDPQGCEARRLTGFHAWSREEFINDYACSTAAFTEKAQRIRFTVNNYNTKLVEGGIAKMRFILKDSICYHGTELIDIEPGKEYVFKNMTKLNYNRMDPSTAGKQAGHFSPYYTKPSFKNINWVGFYLDIPYAGASANGASSELNVQLESFQVKGTKTGKQCDTVTHKLEAKYKV